MNLYFCLNNWIVKTFRFHNWKAYIITGTILWVLLSLSVHSNSIISQDGRQPGSKSKRKWSTEPTAPLGAKLGQLQLPGCWNLLMGWRRMLQCNTAVLHYSSHPEPIQWIASFFALNGCKQRFWEGWMISTCYDFCVLCWCLQAEPPLNSIGG